MGSVLLFDAERMQEIEDTTVVAGFVDVDGHLLLEQRNGTEIDAGLVKGSNGTNGTNGNTLLSGAGAPGSGVGVNGDFYINTTNSTIYGPKTAGAWGSGTSLVGATGATGPTGPIGAVVDWPAIVAPTDWGLCDGTTASRTTNSVLFGILNPVVGVFTVTIAAPGVFTLNSHGMGTGQAVYLTTTGALPTGLTANTVVYYVIWVTVNTFRLATSLANALAGTAITTTGSQSGAHTVRTTYGVGDGSTTFNKPDYRGAFLVGMDVTQTEFSAMGLAGGAKTHSHVLSGVAQVQISTVSGNWASIRRATAPGGTWTSVAQNGSSQTGSSGSTSGTGAALDGAADAVTALPPHKTVNRIIRLI